MPFGYVYMISSSTGNYIGSTTYTVNDRLCRHKYDINTNKNCSSKIILNGENVSVKTLEEVEYIDKDDTLLKQEEQKWIDMTDCVNIERAYTPDDWRPIFESEYNAKWSSENYERKKELNKHHREKQKVLTGVKVKCEYCDAELCIRSMWGHNKRFHSQND
jgi:hypothetical protein